MKSKSLKDSRGKGKRKGRPRKEGLKQKFPVHSNQKQYNALLKLRERIELSTRNATVNKSFELAHKCLDLQELGLKKIEKTIHEYQLDPFQLKKLLKEIEENQK